MDKYNKTKTQKTSNYPNPLEALKDISSSTVSSFKKDLVDKLPEDFMDQLFGPASSPDRSYSGEIAVGESIEINQVYSGELEENRKFKAQVAYERRLQEEENVLVEKRMNQLRLELKALAEQIINLTKKTGRLAEELEIAAIQAPTNPGIYHIIFFEQLLEFLKSFSSKIDEAGVWLHKANKRANKKGGNVWGANYKKTWWEISSFG